MTSKRTAAGLAAAAAIATSGALLASPAQADLAPQPSDVVSTGSDILQTTFNFLADGYGQLPGYNTAGNKWRFINFDSSGDAQGRSAFIDPRTLAATNTGGTYYVKRSDVKQLNPTISIRAGQKLVVRPSGGSGGGLSALLADSTDANGFGGFIDIGRTPSAPTAAQVGTSKVGDVIDVQIAQDRQLIAVGSTTNAPANLPARVVAEIYRGHIQTWGQIDGGATAGGWIYHGPGAPLTQTGSVYAGPEASQTIVPLYFPSDAGMWTTFANRLTALGLPVDTGTPATLIPSNPNAVQVQQNDPTAIPSLGAAAVNAIEPFPRSRYYVVSNGLYAVAADGAVYTDATGATGQNPTNTNAYNGVTVGGQTYKRQSQDPSGITLLDYKSTAADFKTQVQGGSTGLDAATFGINFGNNALLRKSDLDGPAWQPGSTLSWVRALFYNPGGSATPFVDTAAGKALIEAAGQVPSYSVVVGTASGGGSLGSPITNSHD